MKFFQFPADLVTFTEEILNGKLHFLCSEVLNNYGLIGSTVRFFLWILIFFWALALISHNALTAWKVFK